jgi:plastocyanin
MTVVAEDIRFSESTFRAEAGSVAVTFRNDGSIEHTLVIEGVAGFKLDVPANGDVDEGTVDLQAGDYTLYCDVPGHRDSGMEATLEVA